MGKIIRMNITISPEKTLQAFQDEFHSVFPYLRIKFFAHTHLTGEGSLSSDELPGSQTFGKAGNLDHSDAVLVSGAMTVRELESAFQNQFKIGAQVMRKSGSAWIMTTRTDDWTLRKSNEAGREDS